MTISKPGDLTQSAADPPLPPTVLELYRQWREARDTGSPLSVEDVCAGQSEFAEQLLKVIADTSGVTTASRVPDSGAATITGPYVPSASSPIPDRIGRFEVRGFLGGGGFGRVYRAHDPTLRREVAIKVPQRDKAMSGYDKDQFLNEARATATIRHPNIVPVYEIGEHDGCPFIVMAYVPGPTLAGVLAARAEPFPPHQAAAIVRSLALAVQAAHERTVLHRDLKPSNVLYDTDHGEYMVTDFGLACVTNHSATVFTVESVAGTPQYMAPEQARGGRSVLSPRSDVYSLGVILFELLTGQPPFTGGSVIEIMLQVMRDDPPSVSSLRPGLPRGLDAVCRKALAKKPEDRYLSAQEFAAALTPFLTGETKADATTIDYADRLRGYQDRDAARMRAPSTGLFGYVAWLIGIVVVIGVVLLVRGCRDTNGGSDPTPAPDPSKSQTPASPDRRVAEWVLNARGQVEVIDAANGEKWIVTSAADLPATVRLTALELPDGRSITDFAELGTCPELTRVDLGQCPNLTDAGIAALARQPRLVLLRVLNGPRITDVGIRSLERHPALERVYFADTKLTVAGVASIVTIPNLRELSLHGHPITDDWLAVVGQARGLEQLYSGYSVDFPGASISATGFAHLAGLEQLYLLDLDSAALDRGALSGLPPLPALDQLYLRRTNTTNADLAHLAKFNKLNVLGLQETRITDAGMATLTKFPALDRLYLDGTAIGDEGLQALAACPTLRWVRVIGTQVTDEGVRAFRTTRPDCTVER